MNVVAFFCKAKSMMLPFLIWTAFFNLLHIHYQLPIYINKLQSVLRTDITVFHTYIFFHFNVLSDIE
jgi:hypothetical protein